MAEGHPKCGWILMRVNLMGFVVGEARPWWIWINLRVIHDGFLSFSGSLLMFLVVDEGKQTYVYLTRLG